MKLISQSTTQAVLVGFILIAIVGGVVWDLVLMNNGNAATISEAMLGMGRKVPVWPFIYGLAFTALGTHFFSAEAKLLDLYVAGCTTGYLLIRFSNWIA